MIVRRLISYVAAVIASTVAGTIAASQFVLARLVNLGVEVPLADRLMVTGHDIAGMGPAYAAIIAVGFAIALPVAGLVTAASTPSTRRIWFGLAGAVALVVALLGIRHFMGIAIVAGARGALGMSAQALAGALGGWLFAQLSPPAHKVAL